MSYQHPLRALERRAFVAFSSVALVMTIGMVGLHRLEGMSYLDAFYFMSMIATAQGPSMVPQTGAGKCFIAVMAFVSVGIGVASLGFLFGPFFGELWHIGVHQFEERLRGKR